jgi:hypothetical protein
MKYQSGEKKYPGCVLLYHHGKSAGKKKERRGHQAGMCEAAVRSTLTALRHSIGGKAQLFIALLSYSDNFRPLKTNKSL